MSHRTYIAIPLLLAACNLVPYDDVTGASATTATTGTGTGTTTYAGTTTTTGAATAATTTAADSDTGANVVDPTDPSCDCTCDLWLQDCPRGEKCVPYDGSGDGAWTHVKCVPIVSDPAPPGETCTVEGSPVSGVDTCDGQGLCWNVDPGTLTGTCVAMCIGSPDAPACADPYTDCIITNGGLLNLCRPRCDPVAQDCLADDRCIPNPMNPQRFLCALDSQIRLDLFAPCEYANDCAAGLTCEDSALAGECDPMASGCCLPFCDVDEPNTCPGQDLECVPWYDDPADAAPHNIDVGLCRVP